MNPLEVGMLTKGDKEKLKVVRSIKAKADRINKKVTRYWLPVTIQILMTLSWIYFQRLKRH